LKACTHGRLSRLVSLIEEILGLDASRASQTASPKVLRRELPNQMRTRVFRPFATGLSLLLLVAVPAQASPVKFADIVNVIGDLQNGNEVEQLRLRAVTQDPGALTDTTSKSSSTAVAPSIDGGVAPSSTSLVSGTEVAPQQPQGDVQVFEQDQVNGTICDCGEIPAVGGGFPKWPFLALIPLICVTGVCRHHRRVPPPPEVPTPTPTPPIPEPASLLLFGSGIVALSAGARRRYAKMRASKQAAATSTEV
jgi:PEP-CTERM motif